MKNKKTPSFRSFVDDAITSVAISTGVSKNKLTITKKRLITGTGNYSFQSIRKGQSVFIDSLK